MVGLPHEQAAVDLQGPGDIAPLPQLLIDEQLRNPWPAIADRARARLGSVLPSLADQTGEISRAAFGLNSGFFYLPSAQVRSWGIDDEAVIAEFQCVLAIGHFHFAFHDLLIDEGSASAVMCLLSDACLLAYLDGLGRLVPSEGHGYRSLHNDYYNVYAAAVARDLSHRKRLFQYSSEDILGLGDKSAPGATAFHVAADLAGCPERAGGAVRALLRLCTGLQLLDDLNDSAQDARAGNRTWPVTSALLAYPNLDVADPEAVQAAVVGSGAARGCLRLARSAFDDARAQALSAKADVLADLGGVWQARCRDREERFVAAWSDEG